MQLLGQKELQAVGGIGAAPTPGQGCADQASASPRPPRIDPDQAGDLTRVRTHVYDARSRPVSGTDHSAYAPLVYDARLRRNR
jgi:hypothetical protein